MTPTGNPQGLPKYGILADNQRVMNAANATVNYTGLGFRPRACIIISSQSTGVGRVSIGFFGGVAGNQRSMNQTGSTTWRDNVAWPYALLVDSGGTNSAVGVVAMIADGVSITWTKNLTPPANTLIFQILCFE